MQNSFNYEKYSLHTQLSGVDTLTSTGYNLGNRKNMRYQVQEGIFAVIDAHAPQICQIKDFCNGGLSYIYYSDDNSDPVDSLYLDILVQGEGFCIESIPFKKVADTEICNTGSASFSSKRLASIKFENLTSDQKNQVENFIETMIAKTVN